MKKLQAGLILEGKSTSSAILRLPHVSGQLGPVKSGNFQVARRVSNFLRAGYAVVSYEELSASRIVLIRVPDASVERVVAEIIASDLNLTGMSFVLCETWMPTEALLPLRERGAATASLVAAAENKHKCFALDGDVKAIRLLRRMLDRNQKITVELRPGAKHLLFAATLLLTVIQVPLLSTAQQTLRESGVSGNSLARMIEDLASGTLAGFLRTSRTNWPGPLAGCTKESASIFFKQLAKTHPPLAAMINELLGWTNTAPGQETSRAHWA